MNTLAPSQRLTDLADLAIDLASDSGFRQWRAGVAPVSPNRFGGYDFQASGGVTLRLLEDDTQVRLIVFTGGKAMLISEEAAFSAGLAHLAAAYIAEVLR